MNFKFHSVVGSGRNSNFRNYFRAGSIELGKERSDSDRTVVMVNDGDGLVVSVPVVIFVMFFTMSFTITIAVVFISDEKDNDGISIGLINFMQLQCADNDTSARDDDRIHCRMEVIYGRR